MRLTLGATLLASMAVLAPPASGQAMANGDGLEIFRGRQGAYELTVGVQPPVPVVGPVHFTVTPFDAESSGPVLQAEITILAYDPQGNPAFQVRAVNSPAQRQYYDANITINAPGGWTLGIDVHSDALGDATFRVPLHVGASPLESGPAGAFVWIAVIAVLLGGTVFVWYSSRRAQARANR